MQSNDKLFRDQLNLAPVSKVYAQIKRNLGPVYTQDLD